jgi:integrase
MSKKTSNKPPRILKIRQDRDYDCVYIGKKKIMLGRTGSPEAEAAYRQIQVQVLTDPTFSAPKPGLVTVDNLCLAYLQYAQENDPGHYSTIKTAIEILLKNFAGQAVDVLDSRHFLVLQDMFVQYGVSRKYCNDLMKFIRAMLKWGVLRKLVAHQVYFEAKLVPALKEGKTRAYETPEQQPVPDWVVLRTLPFMSPTVATMVQVQRLTGMRPSEICKMRVGDIDRKRGNGLWYYSPKHKTEKHIGKKPIPLGKPEQELIAPYLEGKKPLEAVFSPRTAMQEWHAERRANRKTKVSPSQQERDRQRAKNPRPRQPHEFYDRNSYRIAILNAIKKGNKTLPVDQQIPHWFPYQIRHAAGTEAETREGLDKAQALLGHTTANTTKRYAHGQLAIAEKMARNRRNPFEDLTEKDV